MQNGGTEDAPRGGGPSLLKVTLDGGPMLRRCVKGVNAPPPPPPLRAAAARAARISLLD